MESLFQAPENMLRIMMRTKFLFFILMTSCLILLHGGCSQSPSHSASGTSGSEAPDARQAAPESESGQNPEESARDEQSRSTTRSDSTLCETVPSSDLTTITGIEYPDRKSTANFASIKHCEYFAADVKYSASLLVAFDAAAQQRMEQNRKVPGIVTVSDVGDDAIWEPAQGSLTVSEGNRCTVVQLSTSHGDDETRRSLAIAITNLILGRY